MIFRDLWNRFSDPPELNDPEIKIEMTRDKYRKALEMQYRKGWNDCRKTYVSKLEKELRERKK